MAETVTEKAVCERCGADVREYTAFCYNCGADVADPGNLQDEIPASPEPVPPEVVEESEKENPDTDPMDPKTKAALDDLADRLKIGEEQDEKLAKAAAERRKARVAQRKPKEFRWESSADSSAGLLVLAALIFTAVAGIVVFLTIFWR